MKNFFNLPKEVKFILNRLQEYGQGVLVGGAVRDLLLGYEPKDFDFATDLNYSKLLEIFSEFSPKEIGKSFGIIQIKVEGKSFEIAKFRKDIETPEDRKNQKVEFTSDLIEDLKRRDFTINAIAWNGKELIFWDKNSLKHIKERALVFLGDPLKRISEDPLRILRMIRFISTKNLTPKYILDLKGTDFSSLNSLSKDRIREEFNKILLSKEVYLGLNLITYLNLWKYILPEMDKCIGFKQNSPYHIWDVGMHTFHVVKNSHANLELRISALLHDLGKPETYSQDKEGIGHFYGHEKISEVIGRKWLKDMRYSNEIIENVSLLVLNHMNFFNLNNIKGLKKVVGKIGNKNMINLFKLIEADLTATKPPFDFENLDKIKILYHEIISKKEPLTLNELKIKGNDILSLGFKQGKEIGVILDYLMELVLENPSFNSKENLLEIVKNIKTQNNI